MAWTITRNNKPLKAGLSQDEFKGVLVLDGTTELTAVPTEVEFPGGYEKFRLFASAATANTGTLTIQFKDPTDNIVVTAITNAADATSIRKTIDHPLPAGVVWSASHTLAGASNTWTVYLIGVGPTPDRDGAAATSIV